MATPHPLAEPFNFLEEVLAEGLATLFELLVVQHEALDEESLKGARRRNAERRDLVRIHRLMFRVPSARVCARFGFKHLI